MKVRNSIVISRIKFEDLSFTSLFEILLKHQYSEQDGFGFKDVFFDNDLIKSTLIKKSQTYINEFDIEKNSFEKKNIAIFSEIKFLINTTRGFLYVFGNPSNSNKLKSIFRNLFNKYSYSLNSFEITSANLFRRLIHNVSSYSIEEITISNFSYKEGAIGRYISKISSSKVGLELIENFQNDISRILVKVDDDFFLSIQNNGCFNLICDDYYLESNIEFINEIII